MTTETLSFWDGQYVKAVLKLGCVLKLPKNLDDLWWNLTLRTNKIEGNPENENYKRFFKRAPHVAVQHFVFSGKAQKVEWVQLKNLVTWYSFMLISCQFVSLCLFNWLYFIAVKTPFEFITFYCQSNKCAITACWKRSAKHVRRATRKSFVYFTLWPMDVSLQLPSQVFHKTDNAGIFVWSQWILFSRIIVQVEQKRWVMLS